MKRRDVLFGLSSSLLTACATSGASAPPISQPSSAPAGRILTPVAPVFVERERILKNVVGLRPYRSGGFRLTEEPFIGKHLIHNYGHAGDGVSLSWGCAQVAAEMANKDPAGDIAILGGGVMGLTTGIILAGWRRRVTIYAEDFPPNTTSNIAGALIIVPDNTPARIAQLSHEGWDRFIDRAGYGVKRVDHRYLGRRGTDESSTGFLGRRVRGRNSAVLVDPTIYLARLVSDFEDLGGQMFTKKFETTEDVLALAEPTIINCTGLGAGELFLDDKMSPERGQLTLLQPQPEIDYTYIAREPGFTSLYMFPRETAIVLGGTRDRGNWSLDVDDATVDEMLRRHGELASWAGGLNSAAS